MCWSVVNEACHSVVKFAIISTRNLYNATVAGSVKLERRQLVKVDRQAEYG
jgi:hypothetical protein